MPMRRYGIPIAPNENVWYGYNRVPIPTVDYFKTMYNISYNPFEEIGNSSFKVIKDRKVGIDYCKEESKKCIALY